MARYRVDLGLFVAEVDSSSGVLVWTVTGENAAETGRVLNLAYGAGWHPGWGYFPDLAYEAALQVASDYGTTESAITTLQADPPLPPGAIA